jgi:hypothetical protein
MFIAAVSPNYNRLFSCEAAKTSFSFILSDVRMVYLTVIFLSGEQ